jgi:N-acetylglucosaminylphosphatidylinositol deacetylase
LGSIREKELHRSALHLGLRDESDVFVVDDPSRFPDSMTTDWSATSIASLLASAFAPELSYQANSSSTSTSSPPSSAMQRKPHSNGTAHNSSDDAKPPTATIDVLLTFDPSGISNHPNHRSLHHGARTFLSALMKGKSGYTCPVTLYTLTTTSLIRKYLGVFDAPISMVLGVVRGLLAGKDDTSTIATPSASNDTSLRVQETPGKESRRARRLLFVSGIPEWLKAQKAMVAGHKSQMVWFRWGWITVGRYMVVNDLKREII